MFAGALVACSIFTVGSLGPVPSSGTEPAVAAQVGDRELKVAVNAAIVRGVRYLQSLQADDGHWPGEEERYPGGYSAFIAYTLLRSGVHPSDPDIHRLIPVLAEQEVRTTYATSARLLFYDALGAPPAVKRDAQACAQYLAEHQLDGLWGYPDPPADLSNVQFALLALRAAQRMGIEVPDAPLKACAQAMFRLQADNGGFRYVSEALPTGGITAATLSDLAVLEEFAQNRSALGAILRKHAKETALARDWLAARWNPARNPCGAESWTHGWHFAYLWAVERYCDLMQLERLGGRDWYAEGAAWLVAQQHDDGAWGAASYDTCFALLFLRRSIFTATPGVDLTTKLETGTQVKKLAPVQPDASLERATDVLVAGPWLGKEDATGLMHPPFKPEKLRPAEKGRVGELSWERAALERNSATDLESVTRRNADDCLWAAATRIVYTPPVADPAAKKDAPPIGAFVWLELEDGWRVFFDGVEVSRGRRIGSPPSDLVCVPIQIAPGTHDLVVLVEDSHGQATFGLFVGDPLGKPLPETVQLGYAPRAPAKKPR